MTLSPGAELRPCRMYAVSSELQNGFTATPMSDVGISNKGGNKKKRKQRREQRSLAANPQI